jgi:hypothetical protein
MSSVSGTFASIAASIVLSIIATSLAGMGLRALWRRIDRPPAALPDPELDRLRRIEQAVDAIALEVERISEGQRYIMRVTSEMREAKALPPTR